jgi:hypothetical protein
MVLQFLPKEVGEQRGSRREPSIGLFVEIERFVLLHQERV